MELLVRNYPESKDNLLWGVHLFSFGVMTIEPETEYPSREYFREHAAFWKNGRVLHDLFLVFVSEGSGEFRTNNGDIQSVSSGSLLILFPGVRHSYRPDPKTGWTEHWVGVRGRYISELLSQQHFFGDKHIINDINEKLFTDHFNRIRNECTHEGLGYQVRLIGWTISLLNSLYNHTRQIGLEGDRSQKIISIAKNKIRNMPYEQELDPKALAEELNISYSWFRKVFKNHVGMAPNQYKIHLNIQYASELLIKTPDTIKEIAFKAGFDSISYFCRQFKQKMGMSPTDFRRHA